MEKVVEQIKKNKKVLLIALMVLVGVIGLSYAWFTLVINKNTSLNLRAKTNLDITLVEPSNPIVINTAIPMADADGLATTAYTFKVVNNDNQNIAYQLYLDDVALESGEHKIPDNNIKYSLTRNGGSENPKLLTMTQKTVGSNTVRELDDTIISGKTTTAVENVYTLKLWIDSEATNDIAGYKFKGKIRLEATQTEDDKDDIYNVTGYLYDDNNQPVSNGTVAVYSDQKTATTNSAGLLNINGLEYGTHSVYYVPNKSVSQISGLTKGEIEAISGVGKATIHTGKLDDDITLSNGYTLKNMTKKKVTYNQHIKLAYRGGSQIDVTNKPDYHVGDRVTYEVADGVEKEFVVIKDEGDTLTMEEVDLTLPSVEWGYENGPTIALAALEDATSAWKYVNPQTYAVGGYSENGEMLDESVYILKQDEPMNSYRYLMYEGKYLESDPSIEDLYAFTPNNDVKKITPYTISRTGVRARMITVGELIELNDRSIGIYYGDGSATMNMAFAYEDGEYSTGYMFQGVVEQYERGVRIDYFVLDDTSHKRFSVRAVINVDK